MLSGFVPSFTVSRTPAGLNLAWPALRGWRYQVKCSEDLVTWNDCGQIQPGTGGSVVLDFPTTNATLQFFLLLLNP